MSNEFDIWNGTYLIEDLWEVDADEFTSTDPNDNTQAAVQALIDKYGDEWLVEFVIRVQDMTVTFEEFESFITNEVIHRHLRNTTPFTGDAQKIW